MHRWIRIAAMLCVAAATPLVAQEASSPTPPASASTVLPGPRLRPEYRRVEPTFADSSASGSAVASGTHTITVTTLVLVLLVIIAVLVIAK